MPSARPCCQGPSASSSSQLLNTAQDPNPSQSEKFSVAQQLLIPLTTSSEASLFPYISVARHGAGKQKGFITLKTTQAAQVTDQNCEEKRKPKHYISFAAVKTDQWAVTACYFSPLAAIPISVQTQAFPVKRCISAGWYCRFTANNEAHTSAPLLVSMLCRSKYLT